MASKVGLVLTSLGIALVFGGTVRTFTSMGDLTAVLLWALVALLGVFVAVAGAKRVLSSGDGGQKSNPEKALGKVDPRFGRR